MTAKQKRHRWAAKIDFPLAHKSESECKNGCGIVKVSRREHLSHWLEYWRGLEKISVAHAPACEVVEVTAAG